MKARLPMGFGGKSGNMNNMIKQAQKMQEDIEKIQEEMHEREFKATSGGGAVEVTVNGKKEIQDIEIDRDVINPDEKEMLEDLMIGAINEALRNAEQEIDKEMNKVTGGMNIPGLF